MIMYNSKYLQREFIVSTNKNLILIRKILSYMAYADNLVKFIILLLILSY